jgi:hypothetical protein
MTYRQGIICSMPCAAWLMLLPFAALSQQTQPQPATPAAKSAPGPAHCPFCPKAAPQPMAKKGPPRGPVEKYDCKVGTEDQHARIAVLAQGGEVQSVAYYSKWKPRTCSVHLQRGDAYSTWKDVGDATTITTEFGDFLIQVSRAEYQLFFREVDRMHYCGMLGKLNGSMTVTRGPKRQCSVEGIMDRNEPEPETAAAPPALSKPPAPENKPLVLEFKPLASEIK